MSRMGIENDHAFATHKISSSQNETFLAKKLKSWWTLNYNLDTRELYIEQLFIISTEEKLTYHSVHESGFFLKDDEKLLKFKYWN